MPQSLDDLVRKLDTKPASQRSVFITYQWAQKDTAKALQQAFEAKGFLVIRDEDNLSHGVYLPGFMRIINHKQLDYVLPVISQQYLTSKSCMYEVNQLFRRLQWEDDILPYVVDENPRDDAMLYSQGAGTYVKQWKARFNALKEEDVRDHEVIPQIIKNLPEFVEAVTTQINVPEAQLKQSGYQPFFDLIERKEQRKAGARFQEIEELLRQAEINTKRRKKDKARECFEKALEKLDTIDHLPGTDAINGKVYGHYGEFLQNQAASEDQAQGKEYVEIAEEFGYSSPAVPASSISPTPASTRQGVAQPTVLSRPTEQTPSPQPVPSGATQHPVRPSQSTSPRQTQQVSVPSQAQARPAATPPIDPAKLKGLLYHVTAGEQNEAEAILKANPRLVLAKGDVTDLSGRTFKDITAFQYAAWALDWEMWEMIEVYFPQAGDTNDQARQGQIRGFKTGSWVSQHGETAQGIIQRLVQAYEMLEANWGKGVNWGDDKRKKHWVQQIGSAQLLLPTHVVNEYCHKTRSMAGPPDFSQKGLTASGRQREQAESGSLWKRSWRIGEASAVYRGSMDQLNYARAPNTLVINIWSKIYNHPQTDVAAVRSLVRTRIAQHAQLTSSPAPSQRTSASLGPA